MKSHGLEITSTEVWPLRWSTFESFQRTSFPSAAVHQQLISSGRLGRGDWERFVRLLERSEAKGLFFATASVMLVAGRKPTADYKSSSLVSARPRVVKRLRGHNETGF